MNSDLNEEKDYKATVANTLPKTEDIIVSLEYLFQSAGDSVDIDNFIKQVETVYKGLGVPVLYGVLSILANKSVFFIGGRGVGKTRIIKCIPDVDGYETSKWDTFTLGELDRYCSHFTEILDYSREYPTVRGMNFAFKVEDFSTLGEYHREIFLTVCSKISSDGNYHHVTDVFPHLSIDNCSLTMLIAVQPRLYSLLCNRYTQWESMSYDRFTKFLLLNPLREGSTVNAELVPTLPRKIPPSAVIPNSTDLSRLDNLFRGHVSEGRAHLYSVDYAVAMARFHGKDTVEQEDVDTFYRLFSPYLEPFSELQQRQDLDSTITVSSGHMELLTQIGRYLGGVSKQELSESLRVTERHIERCAEFLLGKELIRQEEDRYHLSTELEQFFNWYRNTFSLTMSSSPSQVQGE